MSLIGTLNSKKAGIDAFAMLTLSFLACSAANAQTCPSFSTTSIAAYTNTYYPATQATVTAGATSITLGSTSYGATPISAYDVVLIIQMQGAQIKSNNNANYGSNSGTASGYLNNAALVAGKMEFAVATSAVPLTGGTLTLQTGTVNAYQNSNYGTDGQYRYQVIRIPVYWDIKLTATITAPAWNGTSGGVIAIYATDTVNMNGQTISAAGKGFRGGGGLNHSNTGSGSNTDYTALSTTNTCASKGEGIAGTPRYIFATGNTLLVDYGSALEGYPGGCIDRGAPGNAGGGATDGDPVSNSNNAGGGGGGNGGLGGDGGRSWSSQLYVGGKPGAVFAQVSPKRLVMGGGGGAGSTDGGTGTPTLGLASSGAPGGGIVIIRAGGITGTGTINVNGASPNATLLNDGAGGGGAGGSVLLVAANSLSNITVTANGSAGASNTGTGVPHGPGGGGGGGVVYSTTAVNASSSATGGAAGTTQGIVPATFGAVAGSAGAVSVITIGQTPSFPFMCNLLLATSFVSASATQQNGVVTVSWQVTNESDVKEYTIEKSSDGLSFSPAGKQTPKATGNSNDYSFSDLLSISNTPAVIYYRVRETGINNRSIFSDIMQVRPSLSPIGLLITPNPAAESATLAFTTSHECSITIRMVSMQGHTLLSTQYAAKPGVNNIPLNHLGALPPGIYMVQLNDGTNYQAGKIMIRH